MLTVEEAQDRILSALPRLPIVRLPLLEAQGLVLAEDAVAHRPIPAFASSAMDGYAIRSTDVSAAGEHAPAALRVIGEAAAGSVFARELGPGEAVRIFTGAPVPAGADAVVMQETTQRDGEAVLVSEPIAGGRHIRPVGNDVPAGATVLAAGTPLTPAAIGMLAAMGWVDAPVCRRARVAVLSTGDELTSPGQPLSPGRIYDSNRPALQAQVREAGAEVVVTAHAPDDPQILRSTLETMTNADVILVSGGVSVGDHDHVKDVVAQAGEVSLWRVAVKPGKPLAFGSFRGVPFFGLPGNPVSAYVTFEVFVRPALRRMMGHTSLHRPVLAATLEGALEHVPGRREYVRARLRFTETGLRAQVAGDQDSGVMSAMARANALIIVPEEADHLEPGAPVRVSWLGEP